MLIIVPILAVIISIYYGYEPMITALVTITVLDYFMAALLIIESTIRIGGKALTMYRGYM